MDVSGGWMSDCAKKTEVRIRGPPKLRRTTLNASMPPLNLRGTSANTNAIGTLDTVFPDPALKEIRAKINDLINGLRR